MTGASLTLEVSHCRFKRNATSGSCGGPSISLTSPHYLGDSMDDLLKFGLEEALQLLRRHINPLPGEEVSLLDSADRILDQDIHALVDSPSVDASLKDGYAVVSEDIVQASKTNIVTLHVKGTIHAGETQCLQAASGTAIKVLSGAELPAGATSVVAEEFTRLEGTEVQVMNTAEPGRNVLYRGGDIKKGAVIANRGSRITPGLLGLIAASGHSRVAVIRKPAVGIIATGDEVVAPGVPLPRGKLYASNITTLAAWCRRYGFTVHLEIVPDNVSAIEEAVSRLGAGTDALITSGGAWTGDHDLVARVLVNLGGIKIFHRLRIGPGKATGLVMLSGKPVFILPGGPPSNLMGYLQIALPGLFQLSGLTVPPLPCCTVRLGRTLQTDFPEWTQFFYGRLQYTEGPWPPLFIPLMKKSRLRSMAEADAVVAIPEGQRILTENSLIPAQLLN